MSSKFTPSIVRIDPPIILPLVGQIDCTDGGSVYRNMTGDEIKSTPPFRLNAIVANGDATSPGGVMQVMVSSSIQRVGTFIVPT